MNRRVAYMLAFLPVLLVYMAGLPVDVMDVDASQYAEMSREMLATGDYLQLHCRSNDYLDKPPFLFWITSFFYAMFGVSDVVYKLPSLLFALLGIYATYRLGRKLYDETTGYLAALMLSTTQAWFQFTNDVRTDTILAGAVIAAIWQLVEYLDRRRWYHFSGATICIAIAMLTKGPIGLMVPVLALGTDALLKRSWRTILRWEWALMAVSVLVLLSPMLWGLYLQYDLHPGKVINGQTICSGLRFYFWTQSFGRLTGESNWSNDPSFTGFLPILGWAFLPWTVFLIGGLWMKLREIFRFRITTSQEAITFGGFVFPFIALSLSNYKLPHYIFILFPLGAIMSAYCLLRMINGVAPWFRNCIKGIQWLMAAGYAACACLLLFFVFTPVAWLTIMSVLLFLGLAVLIYLRSRNKISRLVLPALSGALIFNLVMNLHFYPHLLAYQSTSVAAKFYKTQLADTGIPVVAFDYLGYSFDFYVQHTMGYHENTDALQRQFAGSRVWVFTNEKGLARLEAEGVMFLQRHEFPNYRVTGLSLQFLDPATRSSVVTKAYLVLVQC